MDDPISLATERSRKTGDSRDWSVLDALKETMRAIEAGEDNPDMIMICMRVKDGEKVSYPSKCAGVTHLEAMGLLYRHLDWACRDSDEEI